MEQSSSRLYSGPLSQAAQKILAVLRAQSNHSNNHRQMERYYGSQREPWAQSSRSMSQEKRKDRDTDRPWSRPQVSSFSTSHHSSSNEQQSSQTSAYYQYSQTLDSSLSSPASSCWDSSFQRQTSQMEAYYQRSQTYSHRKYSQPPAYQSSQAPSFTQCEASEVAACYSLRDRFTLALQIPERPSEHQCRNSTDKIRPSFILRLSPDDESPDEILFRTVEHPKAHKKEPGFACHPVSSCRKISVETDNGTIGAVKEKKVTKSWNILRNELEDAVASDSQLKWKRPQSDPAEEAISGEDGGVLHQQSESETIKTGRIHLPPSGFVTSQETRCDAQSLKPMRHLDVEEELIMDSENMTRAGTEQMSDRDNAMHSGANGVKYEETGQMDATSETHLGRDLDLACTSNMDKQSFHCYSEGSKSKQKEDNDPEYRLNTPGVKDVEQPPGIENKEIAVGYHSSSPENISVALERGNNKVNPCQAENLQVMGQTETAEEHHTEEALVQVQCEPTTLVLGENTANNLDRPTVERDVIEGGSEMETEIGRNAGIRTGTEDEMETEEPHCSDVQLRDEQCEIDYREAKELPRGDTEPKERGIERDESVMPPVNSEDESTPTEDSGRERCPTPTLSQECKARGSMFKVACLSGNHQHRDSVQAANRSISGSSSRIKLAPAGTFATGLNSSTVQDLASSAIKPNKKLENCKLPTFQTHLRQPSPIPSFPLKRKHEALQHQNENTPHKVCPTRHPPKWEPSHSSQEKAREGGVREWKRIRPKTPVSEHSAEPTEPQTKASQTQQSCSKMEERGHESTKQTPVSVTFKPPKHKQAKRGPDRDRVGLKISHELSSADEPQSRAGYLTETLTSDSRVRDSGKLNMDEKMQMLEKAGRAKALVLTMVYQDGTTQLDPEQKLTPPVCGLLVLMKNDLDCSVPEDSLGPNDSLVYLKLEQTPAWAQQHTHQSQELFTRDMLLQVLSKSQLVVCYKAKDLLRTTLQFYKQDLSWKQVAGCHIQDPQVSAWLLDPADPSSSYQDLLKKHGKRPSTAPALGTKKVPQVISGLTSLYSLNMELCSKLQSQGLWKLYSDMELNMIPVLAAMESHCIHVDKEALKRTSDLLGTKMKQLEQEAHRAAGQIFLVTSNTQLRTVLFEKLRLHERCENKKLPKTVNKQQQSTSEAALLQLQDLHPLPKIILEYRQVHKIKSTFVDGILSCMMSKNYISSTWYQTSVVTGRISAKQPNFQALPRQPLQLTKKQYIQGKEEEVVTVHPRALFIPQKGCSFLAADFCQVELRLLAHLSSDPELLRIFTNPQADVFTMLASQWKGVSEGQVTSEDREHAKRIVYSVVYGAGRERLSGILGVSADQARQFQDSFLQTYKEVQVFIQRTIQLCHKQGYVLSIMGRRRTLPHINSPDWGIRMQAERQAVNFMVQGSAADLCKMAMIRIFNLVSSSTSLSARLIAQLHDELLYEVEDSQVEHFAALVKHTMESLQHVDHLGVHLKVPLKVAVSSGKSWGSMSELTIPPTSPSPSL
ncbi:DNA polymerase nu isoform X2 [Lates calcarifer]|uniref:DNA-directed DNA polymerase n=1 Tax=Lates calcarifer TaxID=8187 RepID=A0AAJ7QNU6_LATCA|nr:DNA polymerase nu isoform X2 [Lates calcarifer]